MRFTGRQVTTMVVAGCAAVVLAPTVAVATGTSLVSIVDGTHHAQRASVSHGRLQTSTTGKVGVSGVVTTAERLPKTSWAGGDTVSDTTTKAQFISPTNGVVGITSLVIHSSGTGDALARVRVLETTTNDCSTGSVVAELFEMTMAPGTVVSVPYAAPPTFRKSQSNGKLCVFGFLDSSSSVGAAAEFNITGFVE